MARFKTKILAFINEKRVKLLFVFLFMLTPVLTFAQTGPGPAPCNDGDVWADPCPLDDWVWLLVAFAIIAVMYQNLRKRKIFNSQA